MAESSSELRNHLVAALLLVRRTLWLDRCRGRPLPKTTFVICPHQRTRRCAIKLATAASALALGSGSGGNVLVQTPDVIRSMRRLMPYRAINGRELRYTCYKGLECNNEPRICDELRKQIALHIDCTCSCSTECRTAPVEQGTEPPSFKPEPDAVRCEQLHAAAQAEGKLRQRIESWSLRDHMRDT